MNEHLQEIQDRIDKGRLDACHGSPYRLWDKIPNKKLVFACLKNITAVKGKYFLIGWLANQKPMEEDEFRKLAFYGVKRVNELYDRTYA